jgi:hypothetical protein
MIQAIWKTYEDGKIDIVSVRRRCGYAALFPRDGEALHVLAYDDGTPIATGRMALDGEMAELDGICAALGELYEPSCDLVIRMMCAGAIKAGAKQLSITAGLEMEKLILPLGFIRAGEIGPTMGYYAARAETVTFNTCRGRGN